MSAIASSKPLTLPVSIDRSRHSPDFGVGGAQPVLIIFAPLVLILAQLDYSTKWTALACAVYFWACVAHLIVYTLGLPVFRTLAFTVGFLAQAVLALAIFKVL
jgi:hypothetical protein